MLAHAWRQKAWGRDVSHLTQQLLGKWLENRDLTIACLTHTTYIYIPKRTGRALWAALSWWPHGKMHWERGNRRQIQTCFGTSLREMVKKIMQPAYHVLLSWQNQDEERSCVDLARWLLRENGSWGAWTCFTASALAEKLAFRRLKTWKGQEKLRHLKHC